jgi:hypothetical protein
MNSKRTLVLITAALLLSIGGSAQKSYANSPTRRMAQAQRNQSSQGTTDKNKTSPAAGCSLLTPAMLEKVVGRPFKDNSSGAKMPPAYEDTAWGSICEYGGTLGPGRPVRVDFMVFVEASAAKAKQVFDSVIMFYLDSSKPKPAIGDSAYWDTTNKREPSIHVLKGKVHFKIAMAPLNEKQLTDLAAAVAAGI